MSLYTDKKPTVVCDTEVYKNYWSIAFRCVETKQVKRFEQFNNSPLDRAGILNFIRKARIVTFNGANYDAPMIALALRGVPNAVLKEASDDIIVNGVKPWVFADKYGARMPDYFDHIDLMEVSPGSPTKPSLKIYSGRLHSRHMQDLPLDPAHTLSEADRVDLCAYHDNDLEVTHDLYNELLAQIELRALMSDQYHVDLRSKSDAQIAEAVIKVELERITGTRLYKPEVKSCVFSYRAPAYIKFKTPELQSILERVLAAQFVVGYDGVVRMPDSIEGSTVTLGTSTYKMGIGGLHSMEAKVSHFSDDDYILIDRDVTSYYPNIIMSTGLFPVHLGNNFLQVYRTIYERRLKAKRDGQKNVSETLKIVLNGSFGKFGSPYSFLYAPNLMIQTTITGQLAILMLIEAMHLSGMQVVSANTDGFVTKVPRNRLWDFDRNIDDWEVATSFDTEEVQYKSLHSASVNGYVAITTNGKVKRKGSYTSAGPGQPAAMGMKKNPTCEIAVEAAIRFMQKRTPIEQTIRQCADVRKFVAVRRVNGGAMKGDNYVGKAVRFYYAEGEKGALTYKTNGNLVPKSEGAKPLMALPDELPADIDCGWYIREAYAILEEVGLPVLDPQFRGLTGTVTAYLPGQKTAHVVDVTTGIARCGKAAKNIRDGWVIGDGNSCKKCLQ